jgi:hypothetical protein
MSGKRGRGWSCLAPGAFGAREKDCVTPLSRERARGGRARGRRFGGSLTRFVMLLAVAMALVSVRGGAQPGAPVTRRFSPRYERVVQPGAPGPNRLELDSWVVATGQPFAVTTVRSTERDGGWTTVAQGGLADLRLYDSANREVPYLLVPPPQPTPTWVLGTILPIVETKNSSGFEVTLEQPLLVDRLRIDGLRPPFLKRAIVEGSGDRERWTALAPQATLFDLPDDRLRQVDVTFPAGEYRYLRVTWDDRSSGRLPLPGAVRVREATKVPAPDVLRVPLDVEKRPSEPGRSRYRLLFPAARMPVTDLEIVASDPHILRLARVTEPQLSGNQLVPREFGAGTLRRASRAEDDATAADMRVRILSPPMTTRADLTIEDGNNPPLELTGVTAVLAPLPWIYFESRDGAPLVARLGDRRATTPTYDLEAVRARLTTFATADATWGPPPASPLPASSAGSESTSAGTAAADKAVPGGSGALLGAAIDVSEFRFARDVPAGPAGLTVLALDAGVLAHSRLLDLRVVDREGRQRAYVLESREEPLTISLGGPLKSSEAPDWLHEPLKNAPAGLRTIYRLHLPYDALPASKLVLTTGTRVFTRQVALFVRWDPQPGRERVGARRIASATWAHTDPEEPPPHVTFELPSLETADLVLMVDEGDNAALPIESARLVLPGYQIRFMRADAQPLTLYYGDTTLAAPRYDLALLKPYLLDAPASEIVPGPERERAPVAGAAHLPFWAFWGVLAAAVLILLVLIARLLRAESADAGSAGTA